MARLTVAGYIAARDEAAELLDRSGGDEDLLEALVQRRLHGEPLAWIVGVAKFCGLEVRVDPGVYVPRWQSEPLARRAATHLPRGGTALDICTGSGAIAMSLRFERPEARVIAVDIDEASVNCAASNGVEVLRGDLFAPLPLDLRGVVDVVVAVVPYVPTESLNMLPRDTFAFESTLAYDGGERGLDVLRRVVRESPRFLRSGGALLLELGGDEADALQGDLDRTGFSNTEVLVDDDGDVRGIESTFLSGG